MLGWRFFPHYFIQLYVPLALAAAPWLASVLVWPGRRAVFQGTRFAAPVAGECTPTR
jgi:hypothetical protein